MPSDGIECFSGTATATTHEYKVSKECINIYLRSDFDDDDLEDGTYYTLDFYFVDDCDSYLHPFVFNSFPPPAADSEWPDEKADCFLGEDMMKVFWDVDVLCNCLLRYCGACQYGITDNQWL